MGHLTSDGRLERWFESKRGRPPKSLAEVGVLWDDEYFRLNPFDDERRRLTVGFAELRGGKTLAYLKAFFPDYWSIPSDATIREEQIASVGLTGDEENEILTQMFEYVDPRLKASEAWLHRDDPKVYPNTRI